MIAPLAPGLGALAAVGSPPAPAPPTSGWDDRLDEVVAHGLAGLLAEAWRGGLVTLADRTLDRLETRLEAEARRAVQLEAELLRLAPLLERHHLVLLKGPGLAHGAYPDPSWRPFTDLDLLVPTRWLPATLERLAGYGYRRPRPDPSPGFLLRVGKATALDHPDGLVVDLHRTLVAGNLGEGIDIDELVDGRIVVAAGAVRVPAPAWPAHLIEVALHALLGDGLARAISLRDVVQVAAHTEVDPRSATTMAERWGVAPAVAASLAAAHQALGVAVPPAFARWVTTTATDERLWRPGPRRVRSARRRLDELRHGGARRRATLVRSLLVPDPAFLRWSYGPASLPSLYRRRWHDLRDRRREGQPIEAQHRPAGRPAQATPGQCDGAGEA